MKPVNMVQARIHLSRLVEAIVQGEETEIVIARRGRPVARLVAPGATTPGPRIGIARGLFEVPGDTDAHDEEIARRFLTSGTR